MNKAIQIAARSVKILRFDGINLKISELLLQHKNKLNSKSCCFLRISGMKYSRIGGKMKEERYFNSRKYLRFHHMTTMQH